MPAFIAQFRAVLDELGLEYGMFGHADVGCVHVRPALDLCDPAHEDLLRSITDRVVELVADHGGVLWGEHGRGLRGDNVTSFLTPETIGLMRQVKTAFDPRDLLNPGKLYRPTGIDEPIVAVDAAPLRGQHNRKVALSVRQDYADAFACNGNGLCHHHDQAEIMCPSYKVTKDPALSPNGRADLIRAWLAGDIDEAGYDDAIAENLNQCLSCSACTGHCPVEVDIPELKSRFLDQYYATRRRPLSHQVMSRFETLASLGAKVPSGLTRLGLPLVERALGLVGLPLPEAGAGGGGQGLAVPFDAGLPRSQQVEIVILPDVFTSALEPATLSQAVGVLQSLGYSVARAGFVASGKFDHVKGKRAAFAKAASAQRDLVSAVVAVGAIPVVIEPAVALLHDHEYPNIVDGYPRGAVKTLVEVIEDRVDRLPPTGGERSVTLLGHCTERALAPDRSAGWRRVLEAAGYTITTPDVGCCGMAGVFGHERENQDLSAELFDLSWRHHLDPTTRPGANPVTAVATGYSCRSQVKRFAGQAVHHPVHLL